MIFGCFQTQFEGIAGRATEVRSMPNLQKKIPIVSELQAIFWSLKLQYYL